MTAHSKPSRVRRFAWHPLSMAVLLALDASAWALPTDAVVKAGQVSVAQPTVGTLVVNQSTDKAIVDWRGFSIGVNETVRFDQPTSQSAILNRVTGYDPSLILGNMQSNGRVFLLNPHGIVFGETARVDVGSLVASTMAMEDQDFLAGRYLLSAGVRLGVDDVGRGALAGKVINQGRIIARDGDVVLAGREVVNTGQIIAEQGRVGLIAASKVLVDVEGDGLLFFEVEGRDADARLEHLGEVKAVGGSVELMAAARARFSDTVLNMSGVVQSRGLGNKQGRIVVDGGGTGITRVSGTLDVSGLETGQHGGSVAVLGDRVALLDGARIDARGDSGGGSVMVGGDFKGEGTARRSSLTVVAQDARIDASATRVGDGGQVVVWSDGLTAFKGSIAALGGALSGNGGLAEVSGKARLDFDGMVNLSAPHGLRGQLLLDPLNLEIGAVDDLNGDATAGDDLTANILASDEPIAGTSKITAAKLVLLMNTQDVSLAATNDITVKAVVDASANANSHGLTLTAGNAIDLQHSIRTKNGAVVLTSGTGGITQAALTTIDVGNSTVSINANGHDVALNGSVTTTNGTASAIRVLGADDLVVGSMSAGAAGTITLDMAGAGSQTLLGTLSSGHVVKSGAGTLTLSNANAYGGTTTINAGAVSISNDNQLGAVPGVATPAKIVLNGGALNVTGNVTLNAKRGISLSGPGTIDVASTKALLYGGSITGTGALTKTGGGELALLGDSGNNTYSGQTTVSAGTLSASGGALSSDSAVTIAAAGTLDLSGANSVAAVTLNGGTISGTGDTLTAASYTLNGGTVGANLGAGTLTQASNTTTLDGTSAAATVNVTGGTLTLGGDNRLSNAANVSVSSGATLAMGHNHSDTVASVTSDGTIAGTGSSTLTATTYTINQGTLDAKLGVGTFTKATAGTATVNGTLAATTVNVDAGTLTLGSAGRLASGATVNLTGTLGLAGAESVNTLNLTGGTLDGVGQTLSVSNAVSLQSGTLNANVAGAADVTKTTAGVVTVNGTVSNDVVNVNAGLLALGSANRFANDVALTVNGGTVDMGGFADTVGVVSLQSGAINNGSLTGDSYAVQAGTIGASLVGGGALTKTGAGTVILSGNNSYGTTLISAGALQVGDGGTSGTLGSGAVTNSGTLVINRSDAVTVSSMGGTGGLTQEGTGTTTLAGTNTYSGATTVNHGVLTTAGASNLSANSAVTVNSDGVLTLAGNNSAASVTLNSGTVNGTGHKLTAATYALNGGTVNTKLGAGVLTQTSNTTTLNDTVDAATVNVNGGTLSLGAAGLLSASAAVEVAATLSVAGNETVSSVTLNGGTINGTGHAVTAATYELNGGTVNANLGAGTLNQRLNTTTLNGTSGATLVNVLGGTLLMGAANRLSATADLNIDGGIMNLGGFAQTSLGDVTLVSGTLSNGALAANSYDVRAGSISANLGGGALTKSTAGTVILTGSNSYTTTEISAGTLQVGNGGTSGTLGAGAVVNNASLAINRSNAFNVADVSGSGNLVQDGTGTTTLSGVVSYSGSTTVNAGTLSGPIGAGALTVNSGATMALTADTSVASFTLNNGTLGGVNTLSSASGYALNGGTVQANLGAGTLTQASGTTVINGSAASDTVNITDGTLTLGSDNRLNDSAAVTIANGAALALGAHSDTVGSLVSNGNVTGSGTLTAATYTLNQGTVSANLGAGTLTKASAHTVNLNGTSDASVIAVNAGTMTLGSAGRLTGHAAVSVNGGSTLNLGGNESAASLSVNSATLGGSGTLTAATYALQAATVNANLGLGTLTQLSGLSTLNGTFAGSSTVVSGGTLALGGNNLLSDTSAVDVAAGATLAMGTHSDTVGSLTSSGNVTGSGTLTANTYVLNAGIIDANLGTGTLTKSGSGSVTLHGQSAATQVDVNTGGTLVLGGAGRLASGAAVTVAGTLSMAGDESVNSLALNGGVLQGVGHTLTASTYALSGGTAHANLGAGTLTQVSGASTLNGSSAATTVNINGGTLTLGAADRLADLAAVTVLSGAQLNLGGAETVGSIAGAGNIALGANTLTTGGNHTSTAFSGGLSGTGGVVKQGSGTWSLSGSGMAYSGATTVNAGTLSGPIGSGALTVNSGATMALTADTSVSSFTLNNGTLGGVGNTLSSTSGYALNGGTVQANLGAGTLTQASGTTVLHGSAASTPVNITGGTLTLGAAERLSNSAAVTVSSGAQLNLGGAETVGSMAGAGNIALGSFTLTTGGNATSTTYSGVLSGEGGLIKQGAGTLTLAGDNTYSGTTTISAGTVQVGDAGASGRLGSGDVVNNAALVFNRGDNHTVANNISGSGSVTHAGNQTLALTGTTTIGGTFASTGHWHTSQALTAGSVSSSGNATLGGNVTTTAGGQTYSGTVTTTTSVRLAATGDIVATNTGNDFTAGPLSIAAHAATIDGGAHALRLGETTLAATSDIHAGGKISLEDDLVLNGGTLTLTGDAAPSAGGITDGDFNGKPYNVNGALIGQGSAGVEQSGGTITTVVGSHLSVRAPGRGSILLEQAGNQINGTLSAISGPQGDTDQARFSNAGEVSKLGFVRIDAAQINAAGIEGDVVKLSANSLTTPSGLIRGRLPYNNQQGTTTSLPALTFVLKQPGTPNQFGAPVGPSGWLQVSVGDASGGYVTVRPQNYGLSATAVWLGGAEPPTPFYDGAGKLNQIPIYYNGKAPSTPQAEGALSAVTTVIEDARRANFDEAVRTENVSSRLRSGVISEVGAGRPATEGSDSIRMPASCTPTAGLGCQ